MIFSLLGLIISGLATALPNIIFPINSQVPPVARVSKAFQFEFAESTFSDDTANMSYTLSGSPEWLRLDSSTRSLFGTPQAQDTGSVSFDLVATDDSGSTAMPVTLIVSTNPGPTLGRPIADQLSTYGELADPESLVLSQSHPLALSFSSDTFTNTDQSTVYYALCANNTPLPSWIHFEANTLTFSGTTPQSTSPVELSQSFDIHFTASDVVGFSGAVASFRVIIESHVFTFGPATQIVTLTPGEKLGFSGLQTSLTLDGSPINATNLSSIVADTPAWLSLDNGTLMLSGTPPNDVSDQNFTVSATDIYGDEAEIVVCLETTNHSSSSLFLKPIEPRNATKGSYFEYSLADMVRPDPNLQISVALEQAPWLKYDSGTRTLRGGVPNSLSLEQISLNITVSDGTRSQSQILEINIGTEPNAGTQTSSSWVTTTGTGKAASSSTTHTGDKQDGSYLVNYHGRGWIAAAVMLPLIALAGLIFLLCCYRRRTRRRKVGKSPFILSKHDISRPQLILAEKVGNECQVKQIDDFEYEIKRHSRQSSKAPRLADLRRYSNRWSGFGSTHRSSAAFTELDQRSQYQLAPEDQERLSQNGKTPSRKRHSSATPGGFSTLGCSVSKKRHPISWRHGSVGSSHTPFSRSLSGFGHGRDGLSSNSIGQGRGIGIGHGNGGPYNPPEVRRSWRNPTSTRSQSSDCWISTEGGSDRSELNFPRPPTSDTPGAIRKPYTIHEASDDTADQHQQPTIRPVVPSSEDLWPERKAYLDQRAKSRHGDNALFSAKDTRASSQLLAGRFLRNSILPLLPTQPPNSLSPPTTPHQTPSFSPETHNQNPTLTTPTYSRSSSLSPPLKPSPTKSSPRRLSHLFRHFPVRALSPRRPLRPSATSLNSRFRDAESVGDGDGAVELRLEIDEEGRKTWRHVHVDRPNPLGSHSVRDSGGGDARGSALGQVGGDGEWALGALLSAAEGSRAQRLSALRGAGGMEREEEEDGRVERGGREEGRVVERRVRLGSQRAKRPVSVYNDGGLRQAGKSLRGDLGDVGAFI